jgi:hypothetical protein
VWMCVPLRLLNLPLTLAKKPQHPANMRVCIHTYIHTYIHNTRLYMYTQYTCVYIHNTCLTCTYLSWKFTSQGQFPVRAYVHLCTHPYSICTLMYTSLHICAQISHKCVMYICKHMHTCESICTLTYTCVHICAQIHVKQAQPTCTYLSWKATSEGRLLTHFIYTSVYVIHNTRLYMYTQYTSVCIHYTCLTCTYLSWKATSEGRFPTLMVVIFIFFRSSYLPHTCQ